MQKKKHEMRYTQYRGLAKVKMELPLLFGCMNLKQMANWKWKNRHISLLAMYNLVNKWQSELEVETSNSLCLRSERTCALAKSFFQFN